MNRRRVASAMSVAVAVLDVCEIRVSVSQVG